MALRECSHGSYTHDRPFQHGGGVDVVGFVSDISAHLPLGARTHIDAENEAPP